MADEPIIIVDDKGTEHEFPPGFDPVRAAGIVRAQSGQRKDANAIGFDVNKWTDMASKLPESVLGVPVRWPAAAAGTLLGTVAEGASSPESIATLGAAGRVPNASPNYLPPSILGKVTALGRTIEAGPSAGGRVGVMQRVLGRVLQLPKEPMARGVDSYTPNVSGYVAGEAGSAAAEAIPGLTTSVDAHMPNVSGYGGPGSAGLNRGPLPQSWLTELLDRYAPSRSGYTAGEAANPAAEAIPGLRPSLDPHMPNTSGYGGPGSAGLNRGPLPTSTLATSLDRFGGNTSGYTAGEAANTASQALPGVSMPQATYVPIPPEFVHVYGDWGLAGPSLQEGMLVNATNRAGQMGLQKVGPMLTLPNGSQIATIAK